MGQHVHKIVRRNGTTAYRLWDTNVDRYNTKPLSEDELREALLRSNLYDAIFNGLGWPTEQRIARALEVEKWRRQRRVSGSDCPDNCHCEYCLPQELASVALEAIKARLAEIES